MRLIKKSQISNYHYTEEDELLESRELIARDPNTSPDVLRKILEQGKDDYVSMYAANNPNCPPDVVKI